MTDAARKRGVVTVQMVIYDAAAVADMCRVSPTYQPPDPHPPLWRVMDETPSGGSAAWWDFETPAEAMSFAAGIAKRFNREFDPYMGSLTAIDGGKS